MTTLEVDGVPVFEAKPDGTPGRSVVVIQEAFGVNRHIEDVCRRFAGEGFHAVAPHLFHRTGDGVVDYGQFDRVMEHMAALDDDKVMSDVDAGLSVLADAGASPSRVAVVGFCFGGRVSFLVATRRTLGAAVGFYGGGIVTKGRLGMPALIDDVPKLSTPWLGLFGEQDASIPLDDVEALRRDLATAPVDTDVVVYEGAGHGFFCDQRDSYHADAAAAAWRRTLDWLGRHID